MFLNNANKKKIELNKKQMSCKCFLLFLGSKTVIILSTFPTVQVTLTF